MSLPFRTFCAPLPLINYLSRCYNLLQCVCKWCEWWGNLIICRIHLFIHFASSSRSFLQYNGVHHFCRRKPDKFQVSPRPFTCWLQTFSCMIGAWGRVSPSWPKISPLQKELELRENSSFTWLRNEGNQSHCCLETGAVFLMTVT